MTNNKNVQIEESWSQLLASEFEKEYFKSIRNHLLEEKRAKKTIYPPGPLIFNAFNRCPVNKVKVVILGQDPYHGPGQAHGLSFSVPDGITIPRSLKNIYKELEADLDLPIPMSGNLTKWADQGVLLLNAMLTVEAHQAGSHAKIGWQNFTDAVIHKLSEAREGLVFMLWGNFAKGKEKLIDPKKHHILKAGHPSPLSVRFFTGCKHFSKANTLLVKLGASPIDWKI